MDRTPSIRWLRAGMYSFIAALPMLAACIACGVAHGPKAITIVFVVLFVLCGVAGFVFVWVGARKSRAENQRLVNEAQAKRELALTARSSARAR
jgi:hypothetical protein